MSSSPESERRIRRIEEAVMAVEGVRRVKVWPLERRMEVGVAISPTGAASVVLARVREAAEALREPDERWEVGLLDGVD